MGFDTYCDDTIIPSTMVKNGFYCPRCNAHYTPGLTWGLRVPTGRYDTSGRDEFSSAKKLGNECPFCRRLPGEQPPI